MNEGNIEKLKIKLKEIIKYLIVIDNYSSNMGLDEFDKFVKILEDKIM